jgi:hypothetical protein
MAVFWSALAALVTMTLTRRRADALVMALLVFSHWMLDVLVHRPDLPLLVSDQGTKMGLGLWNSLFTTLVLELGSFAAGILIYVRSSSVRPSKAFWTLIGFLVVIYGLNVFGPPPPPNATPAMIAGPALALWLLVFWGHKADGYRGDSVMTSRKP